MAPASVDSTERVHQLPPVTFDLSRLATTPERLGPGAYARAIREGLLSRLTDTVAVPPQYAHFADVRAAALAPSVPRSGALTGVGALWVHGWSGSDGVLWPITVASGRGNRLSAPPHAMRPWMAITDTRGTEQAQRIGGIRVCAPEAAVVAALCREPLRWAFPAAWWALAHQLAQTDDIHARFAHGSRLPARGRDAWQALLGAWNARGGHTESDRRLPVTRRAS